MTDSEKYVEEVIIPYYMELNNCTKEEAIKEQNNLFELLEKFSVEEIKELVFGDNKPKEEDCWFKSSEKKLYPYKVLNEKNDSWLEIGFSFYNGEYYIVLFKYELESCFGYDLFVGRYRRTKELTRFYARRYKTTKEKGNQLWMELEKNKFISKKGNTLTKLPKNWKWN